MPQPGIDRNILKDQPSILRINDLHLHLLKESKRIEILSGVSFRIRKGEVFGLAGESGCGKSLTALSIMGLQPKNMITAGEIFFRKDSDSGVDLLKLSDEELRKIRGRDMGMVFQEPMTSLNPVFTIGRQIGEVFQIHQGLSYREAKQKAVELLRSVMIPEPEKRIDDFPHQFSGGMRQRVMIAMAVACSPRLLIADEPTTALDVTIQAEIIDLLQEIREKEGMAILFISHDLKLISEIADRVAIMYAGRIVEEAPAEALFGSPMHPYTQGLLDSLPVSRGKPLKPIPGTVPPPDALPRGCVFGPRCRLKTADCEASEPSLTQVGKDHLVRCIRAEEGAI